MLISIFFEFANLFMGLIGWVLLILLPGAWITFGLTLNGFPFVMRLLTGIMLAPIIVCLQFYVLRLSGFSFDLTVILLIAINLPALYLIWKRRSEISLPDRNTILGVGAILLVAIICLAPQLLDSQSRMFTGHAWMHADLSYMLANGELWLEDTELAGVRLAYPWAGHVYQAVLSYLLDSAPVAGYIWTNLVWLLCFVGFSYYIVAELGGNRFSRITSFIWLCLGLNFAGYILMHIFPTEITQRFWIGGDYRYTPWVLKFYFFEQIIFGLGLFSSIVYISIKEWNGKFTTGHLILLCALLSGIGIIYPILFVPAALVIGAMALTPFLNGIKPLKADRFRQSFPLFAVLLIAGLITFANLNFLTVDRVTGAIRFPSLTYEYAKYTLLKIHGSVVAVILLLAAFGFVFRKYWREKRNAAFILTIGAFGSLLMNIFLELPYWGNEYKFMFTAAICLAPFSALAIEPILERLKQKAVLVFALVTLVLSAPLINKIYKDYPWRLPIPHPVVIADNFDLRLDSQNPLADLCNTIRQKTSSNTLLVIERTELHFPTLTRRRLYAPPDQEDSRPGVNIPGVDILTLVKGYNKQIVKDRKLIVADLFNSTDAGRRAQALQQILQLNQPLALILEMPRHAALNEWLAADEKNLRLYDDGKITVWVIEPRNIVPSPQVTATN